MNASLYARPVMDHQLVTASPGIALIAHDACKQEMIEWTRCHRSTLSQYGLYAIGATGALLTREYV